MKDFFIWLLIATSVISACKKDKLSQEDKIDLDDNTNTPACNDTATPVVMVHGFLASGDTYANQAMRFTSNNYCGNRVYAFDWNTLSQGSNNSALLDAFIDEVLDKTGATKVNLVGHSAGGGLGYNYLSDATRAAKVRHYVHIGSGAQSGPAGPNGEVPTLNIWSPDDKVVTTGGNIPGAINVSLAGKDHYEVATCAEAFDAMFRFFNNEDAPATLGITSKSNVEICGRVVTLGENEAKISSTIKLYKINAATGERVSSTPEQTLTVNAKGGWGPVSVTPYQTYEFEVNTNESGDRKIHYYREGFTHSNPFVYLRTLPPASSLAGLLLASIPSNDNQSVLVVFSANQAIIAGRDSLSVDGYNLSVPDFCSEDNTTIALFLYDGNNNGQTDLVNQGLFGQFPFLSGVDMFLQAASPAIIPCRFNGRNLFVRNWKSGSEGISIAVFD